MKKALLEVHAPIGRSDPQAVFMANSLCQKGWNVKLIQCLHPKTPYDQPLGFLDPEVDLLSVSPICPMWARSATFEFSMKCTDIITTWMPDIFFAFDFSGQLAIALAHEKGKLKTKTIVMQLESVDYTKRFFDGNSLAIIGNAWKRSLVVYPECNRLFLDAQYMAAENITPEEFGILAPTVPTDSAPRCDREELSETTHLTADDPITVVYTGSIVAESYAIEALQAFNRAELRSTGKARFRIAGPISADISDMFYNLVDATPCAEYLGVLNQGSVTKVIRDAHFSFIGWKPLDTNFYYCAPNKFFQALSLGAIPICVPSPIFLTASCHFPDLRIKYLSWDSSSWANELGHIINSTIDEIRTHSKMNRTIFNQQMSWDIEFERFYNKHLPEFDSHKPGLSEL